MAIAREQKQENAETLRTELAEVPHAILVDFKGLDVAAATDLRRQLREGQARFKVVKNSTALRAIEELPLAEVKDVFVGQTAIAYTDGDVVTLAKTLRTFAKEFETPNFKAGIVDGAPISEEDFDQLAQLPPREELIGKALWLMNYPITGLATALSGILKSAVTVLDAIREKKEEAGEEPVEAAPAEEAEAAGEEEAPAEEAEAAAEEQAPAEEAEAAAEEEAPAEQAEAAAGEEAPAEEAEAAAEQEAPAEEAEAAAEEEAPAEQAEAAAEQEAPAEEAEAAADEAEEAPADEQTEDAADDAADEEEK